MKIPPKTDDLGASPFRKPPSNHIQSSQFPHAAFPRVSSSDKLMTISTLVGASFFGRGDKHMFFFLVLERWIAARCVDLFERSHFSDMEDLYSQRFLCGLRDPWVFLSRSNEQKKPQLGGSGPTQHGPQSLDPAEEFVQKARAEQAAKREKEGIKEEKVKLEVKKEETEEKADKAGPEG